jgi:alpha-tubulin suppressor-like RCC1 family protein
MGAGLRHKLVSRRTPLAVAVLMLTPLAIGQPLAAAASAGCSPSTFSAGGFNAAAISNGTLYMWGSNTVGQLGIGSVGGAGRSTPLPVVTSTGLVSPAAAWTSGVRSFAVDGSGQLWGWGDNHFGGLGQPTSTVYFTSPIQITGPTNVVQVSGGGGNTMALTAGGAVWGWGFSEAGELGFVTPTPQATPIVLPGLSNIAEISDGSFTSVALDANGTVFGSGQNMAGELGLGSGVTQVTAYRPLPGLSNIKHVVINEEGFSSAFVLAVDQNGHVFAAGGNQNGQMGNGSFSSTGQATFAQVPGLDSVTALAAGGEHALALKADGTVWAWGANSYGALGDGTLNDSATPIQVIFPAGTQLVAIAAGFQHSMALDNTGALWSWGSNSLGELGTGTGGGFKMTPVKVALGPVAAPCGSQPQSYAPSRNGYAFQNPGSPPATIPGYDRMVSFYPSSRGEIFYPFPFQNQPTFIAKWFKSTYWDSTYTGGLCFGMAASDQFLFNKFSARVHALYPDTLDFGGLHDAFPGALGASPSPADTNIEQFIDRYHSRQLAEAGALEAIGSWNESELLGGNRAAMDRIATAVASGKTVWVGLGPSKSVADPQRWGTLFAESHAVLAYRVDKALGRIDVYDPNTSGDDNAYIQIVFSPTNSGGGIQLIHHGNPNDPNNISYGGGVTQSGQDFGLPGDWTLMPMLDGAFTDDGVIPGVDNRHWMLDIGGPLLWIAGGWVIKHVGQIFIMRDATGQFPTAGQLLPSGTGVTDTMTATQLGSRTAQATGSQAADVIETDAGAVGNSHQVSISPDSSQVTLSNASSLEKYTATLEADFLASGYGRSMTVSGATLAPGGVLNLSADQAYSTLTLSASGMAGGQANLALEQAGRGGGSTNVGVTIPGNGGHGTVFVGDWTGLAQSLVFETIVQGDGTVVGLLLQDNAGQRQQLTTQLLQAIQSEISQVTDAGIRNSLQAKLDNATKQIGRGDPATAANVLVALDNEVADQIGVAIPAGLATSLDSSLHELTGLLRASVR